MDYLYDLTLIDKKTKKRNKPWEMIKYVFEYKQ